MPDFVFYFIQVIPHEAARSFSQRIRIGKTNFPQEYFVYFKGKRRIFGAKNRLQPPVVFVWYCPKN